MTVAASHNGRNRLVRWILVLGAAALAAAIAKAGQSDSLLFLSTQLRPIAEAQKMRNVILKDFPREVEFITKPPQVFLERLQKDLQGDAAAPDVVGALHGELQPLAAMGALMPLDALGESITSRGIAGSLMALGKFGSAQQRYIPWMQAGYILVANKQALGYLPRGADINALSYDQLTAWADDLRQKTGKRLLGFPAGPQGLMHRFLEGFLYPSFTTGVAHPFRSAEAEAMWAQLSALWKSVNPNSTGYNFMAQPLLSGEVWIGFDHIARVLDALRQKPDEFVAFPAPSGPRGRGYMPVLAGLAVLRTSRDTESAMALIDYLMRPETQIATARGVGFLPVVAMQSAGDLDPALRMGAAVLARMETSPDALPVLPPAGLGQRDGEFDKVFTDTFQLIVLRGQSPSVVLEREAETLRHLLIETGTPCWPSDAPSIDACQAQ
jgi:multiple sugar transport system substrate-binding protein